MQKAYRRALRAQRPRPAICSPRDDTSSLPRSDFVGVNSKTDNLDFAILAPGRGYLKAHRGIDKPFQLLGGAIRVRLSQTTSGVHLALPDRQRLDQVVFGVPQFPPRLRRDPDLLVISGIGTPLMPTEFTYPAVWGIGETYKDSQLLDSNLLVHGMLSEYVRGEDYRLAFDEEVTPTRRHFHLLVAPFGVREGSFVKPPVNTGYRLSATEETDLPFRHVMFSTLEIESQRLDTLLRSSANPGEPLSPQDKKKNADPGRGKPAAEVTMDNLDILPALVTIPVGATVLWKNTSPLVHTVTAVPDLADTPAHVALPQGAEPFNSGNIEPGGRFSHTFTVAGEYRYFCIPHEAAGMTGTVDVIEKKRR